MSDYPTGVLNAIVLALARSHPNPKQLAAELDQIISDLQAAGDCPHELLQSLLQFRSAI